MPKLPARLAALVAFASLGQACAAFAQVPGVATSAPIVHAPVVTAPPTAQSPSAPPPATVPNTAAAPIAAVAANAVSEAVNTTAAAPPKPEPSSKPSGPKTAPAAPPPTEAAIAASRMQLQTLIQATERLTPEAGQAAGEPALLKTRQDAAADQAADDGFAHARANEIAAVDARLKRYSTASGAVRPRLDPAEARDRGDLLARRAQLETEFGAARQAANLASEVYNTVANRRRSAFDAQVLQRTASPLEAGFWTSLGASLGPDLQRLERLFSDAWTTARAASEPRALLSVGVALVLAFVIAWPLRRWLKRMIGRRAASAAARAGGAPGSAPVSGSGDARGGDLHRTAHAVGAVLVDTLLPGLAAVMVNLGLIWGDLVSEKVEALARALVIAVFWGGAVVALSRQLAGASNPRERLLPVSERLAARMRALPWLVAVITGSGLLLRSLNSVVGASLAATIAGNCLVSLAYAGVASLVLVALSGDREPGESGSDAETRTPARALLSLALTGAILLTVGAVFAGFTTLALLVSKQIFWISVLIAITYLLLRFTDDAVGKLFEPRGWVGRLLLGVLNLTASTVDQLGVLASALLQILIVLCALSLALTPFGRNGEMLTTHVASIGEAIHVGSVVISPRSVATGLASLLAGLGLVHLIERWVNRRYLPVTGWDAGVRNSVSTGVRYLGVGLAILWALAAAGLGFKQIALVASALSVGIGFGLQQIVQNFVSGLILLVERPVKVGDWVNVGGVEGDVQRIRVRATEIRTFDRTTLIVPNSDLITKAVQNKTLGDPRGRVQLQFTIGAAADAPRALELIAGVLDADEDVLKELKPGVFIDSLTPAGAVNFNCLAYIVSPRVANAVRSRLYLEVIKTLSDAKIVFEGGGASPATMIIEPGPELQSLVGGLTPTRRDASPAEPRTVG